MTRAYNSAVENEAIKGFQSLEPNSNNVATINDGKKITRLKPRVYRRDQTEGSKQ